MAAWTSYSHAKTSQWEDIRRSLVFLWPQCWVSLWVMTAQMRWRHFLAAHRPFLLTNNVHLKYSRCCNSVRMEYFLQGFSSHICWYRQPADRRLINSQKILSTTGISVLLTPLLGTNACFYFFLEWYWIFPKIIFYQTGWFEICKNMTEWEKRWKRVSLCFKLSIRCMHFKFSALICSSVSGEIHSGEQLMMQQKTHQDLKYKCKIIRTVLWK